ncbi:MAG: S-adenosylmethionine:tRNA ribosyltransferase-isomerase [Desulfovibrio sp.]|nr:S-adenosylmethionine:tRNA ribosyltransferase-isomerase [Desulfovibrio sp.]
MIRRRGSALGERAAGEPDNPDFRLSAYDFDLPEALVAQYPAVERSGSRLMILRRGEDAPAQAAFADWLRYLPEGCLLVANNSRVVPARLRGRRPGGGSLECLLLTPLPLIEGAPLTREAVPAVFAAAPRGGWREAEAEALLRPARKIPRGGLMRFSPDMEARLAEHGPFGRCRILLRWRGDLRALLEEVGEIPLPPYIRRAERGDTASSSGEERAPDRERYQTVYARADKAGSVAAPTAGLHLTPALRDGLVRSGREWEEATLHVGYGTFSPVRCPDIRDHVMHAEYAELPERTLAAVLRAKAEGRAVIAVGTTSARILEGARELRPDLFAAAGGREPEKPAELAASRAAARAIAGRGNDAALPPGGMAFAGWIRAFIHPGRPIGVVDGLITNFHLPGSSLLMLAAALAGRERLLRAYREAVAGGFRFFSYGDAMLIL